MPGSSAEVVPAPGLYEHPVTLALGEVLERLGPGRSDLERLSPDDAPRVLAQLLHERLVRSLESLPSANRLARQISLTNRVLDLLRAAAPAGGAEARDRVREPGEMLMAIRPEHDGSLGRSQTPVRPLVPLSTSELLINGHHDLKVGPEIRRELASADRVDLLCSFLKWNGFRVLEEALTGFLARRPGGLRVITTTYIGATDRRALDALVELGARAKVSYDTSQTRLHAKAWLFHRRSELSTAYIGSSNLSAQALQDGLEWNVRVASVDNGPILRKFAAAFEQYWADHGFEEYDPARDAERFERAIREQRRRTNGRGSPDQHRAVLAGVEVTPRPHQQEILDELAAERAHGHTRNLVVAATGTGKTVIAALDYRRLSEEIGSSSGRGATRPSLLFVAHREEILLQSRETFRLALGDGQFGELLVAGDEPREGCQVFASIQSLHRERLEMLRPEAYDMVIVDEFHHAAADSYDRLLSHLQPKYLVGLTATPERADGKPILQHFDDRIASEIRLWKALDQGLLVPFQYFGLRGPDVSTVEWRRGRYVPSKLSGIYTGDHLFAHRVIQELRHKVLDVSSMRALGFCVDVAHADFMAELFNAASPPIAARAVTGRTPPGERRDALAQLRSGELQIVFSVELLNEGIDLPDVDTVVFLRPTESATVFLQQLGRGLRHARGKPCCTVLDFVGRAHRKFRFDRRFRAIVGGTRRHVQRQVEQGFPLLPSGCSIVLDRESQLAVLDNIRRQLGRGQEGLVEDLRALGPDVGLAEFLRDTGFDLEDVYDQAGRCFTYLRRRAGFERTSASTDRERLERSLWRLLHLDDRDRLDGFRSLLATSDPPTADVSDPTQRMLFVLLGYMREPLAEMSRAWSSLWAQETLLGELRQLMDLLADRTRRLTEPLSGSLANLPFRVHATYSLDEVMAGVGEQTEKGGIKRIQTGVFYAERHRCDLLFVTLQKSESDYTPTTLYQDYPLSPDVFHWETQSSCHPGTETGRRYIDIRPGSDHHALLFVRQRKKDDRGGTMPYLLLGPVHCQAHRGERPMQIEWRLTQTIPARDFQEMKVAAG